MGRCKCCAKYSHVGWDEADDNRRGGSVATSICTWQPGWPPGAWKRQERSSVCAVFTGRVPGDGEVYSLRALLGTAVRLRDLRSSMGSMPPFSDAPAGRSGLSGCAKSATVVATPRCRSYRCTRPRQSSRSRELDAGSPYHGAMFVDDNTKSNGRIIG